MLKRIIVGVIGALVAITVIVFRNTPLLSIVLAFFTVLAAYEIEKCVQVKNKAVMAVSLVFSALVPFYYEYEPELSSRGITIPVTVVLAIYILLLFILMLTDYDHTKFEDVATVIIATTFVPWGFSTLIMLNDVDRTFPDEFDGHHGLFFILFRHVRLFYRALLRQTQALPQNQPEKDRGGRCRRRCRRGAFLRDFVCDIRQILLYRT